ncbi:GNAT family N-acetyltransferase [Streptomyces coffeae]|uniref:GNAT family N-acetyltransferase n=1 Tax=Streptomyces coffeae TaxID=621382 RepID=A0ABS1NPW4_9ACTN|nr:GNAT family N-acetyltransferase [Streptomyces coffeae]MBL1101932.1 GNAT family N-acetyltransferase [Streptomyces coffeae]
MAHATNPSTTTGCFADPLGGLDDATWDELAADRFYSSALWLRLCALEPGGVSGAVHTRLAGGGRAAVPVSAVTGEQNTNYRWSDVLARHGLPQPPPQGVLVGQRRGYLGHLLTGARHTSDAAHTAEAAQGLLAGVRAAGSPLEDTRTRVAMYFTSEDVASLRAAGVDTLPVVLAADAAIDVPEGGWDAWLASLTSKRRQTVRRELSDFDRAGYRVEHHLLPEVYGDVARLAAGTQRRYGHTVDLDAFTEGFRRHGELAGEVAEVLLLRAPDDGAAIGCCMYCRSGDTVYARAVGFDYPRLRGAAEYANLTYYRLLGLPGVRRLHLGMSSPGAKVLRGARLSPLWLLDLSEDSVLRGHDDAVRTHNRAFAEELRASVPAVKGALDEDEWTVYA